MQACKDAGRDFDSIELGIFHGGRVDPEGLKPLADLGVRRVLLPIPSKPADDVLPIMDGYAKLLV